jgi:hypothetical protein
MNSMQRAGLYADYEQVDSLAVTRQAIVKGGLCVVRVESLL